MPVNDVALLERRQTALERLRRTTASRLAGLWAGLRSYDERGRWVRLATPVLLAGQGRAIDTQAAYLITLLGPFDFNRKELLAAATIDVGEPFIALANALSSGSKFEDAVLAGRARAEAIGESGVQWAARAVNTAVEGDPRIVGWRRTLHGGACEWCQVVSTQRYRTADSASFGHKRCGCGVDPLVGTRDPGRVINDRLLGELRSAGAVDRVSESKVRRLAAAREAKRLQLSRERRLR